MRFSVLLPTRNGGRYLPDCIASVLEQSYGDLELVVSDNANTDETPEVLNSFASDPRLKVLRSETVLGVVENWNRALEAARGEYLLLIGDDDCLLPGYFERMAAVLEKHRYPECVTYDAYSFIAPGSFPGEAGSFYRESLYTFSSVWKRERQVTREERLGVLRDMFRFCVRMPLNMQATLVARRAAERIPGSVFQPPFPDHYALNSLLLLADSWLALPERLVVVGISPKSFGHFVYGHEEGAGMDYLGIKGDFSGRLPGSELTNNMHAWLLLLKKNYPEALKDVNISRGAYVRRQVYAWWLQHRAGALSRNDLRKNFSELSLSDLASLAGIVAEKVAWIHLARLVGARRVEDVQTVLQGLHPLNGIATIREFVAWLGQSERGGTTAAARAAES